MASLTTLSKGLIALAVVGAMASAVWHLALKERLAQPDTVPSAPPNAPVVSTSPAPTPTPPTPTPTPTTNNVLAAADHAERGRSLLASGEHAQARVHLEQAVQGGSGPAACLLGEMTLKGQGGIVANQEQAAALFQLAQSRQTICFAPAQ